MGGVYAKDWRAESDHDSEDTKSSGLDKLKKAAADICGLVDTKFIIQSGTHFTEVDSLKNEVSIHEVKRLRDVCKNGDHYLAKYDVRRERGVASERLDVEVQAEPAWAKNFYVIKGNSCVKVDDLSDPVSNTREHIFTLHQECQGGDFYLANGAGFYIIRRKDNTYLHVRDMSEEGYNPHCADHHQLHKAFTDGLYYFATENYFYVLKEDTKFGLVYHRTKDLRSDDEDMLTVSPSIVKFMQNSPQDDPKQGTALARMYS